LEDNNGAGKEITCHVEDDFPNASEHGVNSLLKHDGRSQNARPPPKPWGALNGVPMHYSHNMFAWHH
jgi:hypothetical protein